MNCQEAEPLLAWYVSGALDTVEIGAVGAHVASCPACAAALEDTRWLSSAVSDSQHIPADDLACYALSLPMPDHRRALVEKHAASCAQCAAELELAVQSSGELSRNAGPSHVRARMLAIAASLLAAAALGGWWWTWGQLGHTRAQLAARQSAIESLRSPAGHVAVADLLPEGLVQRGGGPVEIREVAAGRPLLLILAAPLRIQEQNMAVVIRKPDGSVASVDLVRQPEGDFTVWLPEGLAPGGYELRLGDGAAAYRVRARTPPASPPPASTKGAQ